MSKRICGAKRQNKNAICKAPAMANGRCRIHGGASLGGIASPVFKTGKYSKYLPHSLRTKYEEAQNDKRLLEFRSEIALVGTRIAELLQQLGGVSKNEQKSAIWQEISEMIDQRRKLALAEHKRLVIMGQMISAEQLMSLLGSIVEIIRQNVPDKEVIRAISRDLQKLLPPDQSTAE